jgi:hypothetical protein
MKEHTGVNSGNLDRIGESIERCLALGEDIILSPATDSTILPPSRGH